MDTSKLFKKKFLKVKLLVLSRKTIMFGVLCEWLSFGLFSHTEIIFSHKLEI